MQQMFNDNSSANCDTMKSKEQGIGIALNYMEPSNFKYVKLLLKDNDTATKK